MADSPIRMAVELKGIEPNKRFQAAVEELAAAAAELAGEDAEVTGYDYDPNVNYPLEAVPGTKQYNFARAVWDIY